MTYTHRTTTELVMIKAYDKEGIRVSNICQSLKKSRQTIYKVNAYFKAGHSVSDYFKDDKANKKPCGRRKTQLTQNEQDFIQANLKLDWSLDVVKGTYPDKIPCSMRTLYRLADRGIFKKDNLPWKGKRKPNGMVEKRGKQAFRRDICERSEVYTKFEREFGQLEGDTIVGKDHKSAVITLVEKQSTLQTNGRKASDIEQSLNRWLSKFPKHLCKSITFDCGKEFSNWKTISNQHDSDIFFADLGCPVQRGLNEHSNDLLRSHELPKQMDFNGISQI